LNLAINSTYGYPPWIGGNTKAAAALKQQLAMHSPILTAWEHNSIKGLCEDLGVPESQIPDWHSSDFDSVYVLNFTKAMVLSSFHTAHEAFHEDDVEYDHVTDGNSTGTGGPR